jgi:hypothetical protein
MAGEISTPKEVFTADCAFSGMAWLAASGEIDERTRNLPVREG